MNVFGLPLSVSSPSSSWPLERSLMKYGERLAMSPYLLSSRLSSRTWRICLRGKVVQMNGIVFIAS